MTNKDKLENQLNEEKCEISIKDLMRKISFLPNEITRAQLDF